MTQRYPRTRVYLMVVCTLTLILQILEVLYAH